jgi:hypothetical protein
LIALVAVELIGVGSGSEDSPGTTDVLFPGRPRLAIIQRRQVPPTKYMMLEALMNPATVLLCLLLTLAWFGCDVASAQTRAGNVFSYQALKAAELLDRAPTGSTRPEQLAPDTFLIHVRALSEGIARPETITTVAEGIKLLEGLAAVRGPVFARVSSSPQGLTVTYRRTYDDHTNNDPAVTTNRNEQLDVPTYYFFDCRNPWTGVLVTQKKNCTSGCDVSFVFSR